MGIFVFIGQSILQQRMSPSLSSTQDHLLPKQSSSPRIVPACLLVLLATTAVVVFLHGTTLLSVDSPSTAGRPIQPPDLSQCLPIPIHPSTPPLNCCMTPSPKLPIKFTFPSSSSPLRIRPAAHLVDKEYISKYVKAVQLMKDLPHTDPRNFMQQANVHCAYCNGAYDQVGFPNLELLIHQSWLFYPWHRLYLYFHERILAKLIGDDSFALPFWNWDAPDGMYMPSMYVEPNGTTDAFSNSLFNPKRHPAHLPPALVDFNYYRSLGNASSSVEDNLWIMHRQMIENGATSELFMGSAFRAGDPPEPGLGALELIPHDTIHTWIGDPRRDQLEDMGAFYAAARDPIFFAHHANLDRLWLEWKSLGGSRKDPADNDWLDASFLFYDEEAQLVRVKVSDSLDIERLRYRYQDVENHWINANRRHSGGAGREKDINFLSFLKFPVTLEEDEVSVRVRRPAKKGRNGGGMVEVLVVEGIENDPTESTRFDVYINSSPEARRSPNTRECAGSFANMPQMRRKAKRGEKKTNLKLGIGELIEEVGAAGDDSVLVTLVPRKGIAKVHGIYIALLS